MSSQFVPTKLFNEDSASFKKNNWQWSKSKMIPNDNLIEQLFLNQVESMHCATFNDSLCELYLM